VLDCLVPTVHLVPLTVNAGRKVINQFTASLEHHHNITENLTSTSISETTTVKMSKINILLINPNATESMTTNCITILQSTLPPDVAVHPFTAPSPAPTAIESETDAILSAAAAFRALVPLQQTHNYDAMLVACFRHHPLIQMLREEFEIPVIGIMEASLFAAKTLGVRIGVLATGKRSALAHWESVRRYGFGDSCVGVRAAELGVLDLERLPREQVLARMMEVAKQMVEIDRADVITLGCAGMTDMTVAVEEAVVPMGVRVVDGVVAGLHHLVGILRMGGKTAKSGVYMSSREGREARGQEYL
jgi:Asp/Glu/hydantoin racemase